MLAVVAANGSWQYRNIRSPENSGSAVLAVERSLGLRVHASNPVQVLATTSVPTLPVTISRAPALGPEYSLKSTTQPAILRR